MGYSELYVHEIGKSHPRLEWPRRLNGWYRAALHVAVLFIVVLIFDTNIGRAQGQTNNIQPITQLAPISQTVQSPVQPSAPPVLDTENPVLVDQIPKTLDEIRLFEETVSTLADKVRSATVSVSGGSGIIVSAEGLILSCAHVGGEAGRSVKVTLSDGRQVNAVTLGNNHKVDAGMMRITDSGTWPFVPISDQAIQPGRWCFAIGYPVTYEPGQEAPVRLGRVLRANANTITSDCTIMGGDSGGPLFDLQGRLIGINSRVSNSLSGNIHVPMAAFRADWDLMTQGKDVTFPAYLGVDRVTGASDARIGSVIADSAADRAGIKAGDVIVTFNRQPIKSFDQLREAVAQCQPNQSVRIKLIRGGEEIYVRARLGELPRE